MNEKDYRKLLASTPHAATILDTMEPAVEELSYSGLGGLITHDEDDRMGWAHDGAGVGFDLFSYAEGDLLLINDSDQCTYQPAGGDSVPVEELIRQDLPVELEYALEDVQFSKTSDGAFYVTLAMYRLPDDDGWTLCDSLLSSDSHHDYEYDLTDVMELVDSLIS